MNAPGSTAAKISPSHWSGRQLSKLAFPQFALLEQNLQISHHALHSCECKTRCKMPAYSVVKDPCVLNFRTVPLPAETFNPFTTSQSNKKPGVERRAKPSAYNRTGSRDARLICYPEFVIDLACDRSFVTLNAPDNHNTTATIRQTNEEYIRNFSLVKRWFSQV